MTFKQMDNMKYFFKALKNTNKSPKVKLLDPNPNSIKKLIPDESLIKGKLDLPFENYIDDVFKNNPHLSEQEMFDIYHNHKSAYDTLKVKRSDYIRRENETKELQRIRENLSKLNNKRFEKKYINEYMDLINKINKD